MATENEPIRDAVMSVLERKPNRIITSTEVQKALSNLEGRQVTNALGGLVRSRPDVTHMGRGSYMYLPKLKMAGRSAGNGVKPAPEPEPEPHVAMDPTVDEVLEVLAFLGEVKRGSLSSEIRKQPEPVHERVTPDQARTYLTANVRNRDLRMNRVVGLAGAINRGEWQLTSNGIGFDTSGYLRDGQHRLAACVVANRAIDLIVVRGLKPKAQDVMDRNLPRSISDALKLRKPPEAYTAQLGSALQWLYRFNYVEEVGQVHYRNPGERPTATQLLALLDENPEIRDAVRDYSLEVRKSDVPLRGGVFSALLFRFRQIDKVEANLFLSQLLEGTNLAADSPIYVLRRILIQDFKSHYQRMPDFREAALTIKAWNAWREQRPVSGLTFKYGPTNREMFPLPI